MHEWQNGNVRCAGIYTTPKTVIRIMVLTLEHLLKIYLTIGGVPPAVQVKTCTRNYFDVQEFQSFVIPL